MTKTLLAAVTLLTTTSAHALDYGAPSDANVNAVEMCQAYAEAGAIIRNLEYAEIAYEEASVIVSSGLSQAPRWARVNVEGMVHGMYRGELYAGMAPPEVRETVGMECARDNGY